MQVIVFPTGDRVGFDNVSSYKVVDSNVEFTMLTGQVRSIPVSSPNAAAYFVSQIDTLPNLNTATPTAPVIINLKEPYIITYVEVPFTLHDTLITIHGSGFTSIDVGSLWIDDGNTPDYDDFECYCQVIDSNTMRAWWKADGSGGDNPWCITYKDVNGIVSNTIFDFTTNDSLTFTKP